jgi:hypothetical protein
VMCCWPWQDDDTILQRGANFAMIEYSREAARSFAPEGKR